MNMISQLNGGPMKLTLQDIRHLKNKGSLILPDERSDGYYWIIDNNNYILNISYGKLKAPLRCVTIGVNMKKNEIILQHYLEELLTRAFDSFIEETKPEHMYKKYVA